MKRLFNALTFLMLCGLALCAALAYFDVLTK